MAISVLLIQSSLETTPQLVATHAFQARIAQSRLETVSKTSHIHPTCQVGVRGQAESQAFWCNTHNIHVGVRMAKLATLQLGQPVSARFMKRGLINQEIWAPPLLSFPHTMLSVKKMKHNMRLAFIKKLFTNREIGISVQTRYLRFKGMLYERKNYLCDISCV